MSDWLVGMHNLDGKRLEHAHMRWDSWGVEYYHAVRSELQKRKDCNGFRPVDKPLFPGYVFLRFDHHQVHTTTISDMHGMKGFIRFGTKYATASDDLVQALRHFGNFPVDQCIDCLEHLKLPPDIRAELAELSHMPTRASREIALICLLQKMDVVTSQLRLVKNAGKSL